MDPPGRQASRAPHIVVEIRVAAVDDGVAGREQRGRARSTVDSVGSPAGTITQTARGGGERFDQRFERRDAVAPAASARATASALRS